MHHRRFLECYSESQQYLHKCPFYIVCQNPVSESHVAKSASIDFSKTDDDLVLVPAVCVQDEEHEGAKATVAALLSPHVIAFRVVIVEPHQRHVDS